MLLFACGVNCRRLGTGQLVVAESKDLLLRLWFLESALPNCIKMAQNGTNLPQLPQNDFKFAQTCSKLVEIAQMWLKIAQKVTKLLKSCLKLLKMQPTLLKIGSKWRTPGHFQTNSCIGTSCSCRECMLSLKIAPKISELLQNDPKLHKMCSNSFKKAQKSSPIGTKRTQNAAKWSNWSENGP